MTDIFYYSNKSTPCSKILQDLEKIPHIRSKFQYISIDSVSPNHPIQCVPAIVIEGKILQGKHVFDWLEKEKHNNTLPPFEIGSNFSSLHNNEGQAENNHNFTYIEEPVEMISKTGPIKSQSGGKPQKIGDNALDDLINQRKMDIPIPRQRA